MVRVLTRCVSFRAHSTNLAQIFSVTIDMLKPSVLCLVLLSALIPLIAQAPANPPSRLQAIMRDFEAEGFSGVVLVERQGTLEFLQAYGYADRRRKIRNTPDTRFEMASLTKPFTAAAILKLQEQGKLRTSDRLDRYIGPLNPPKNLATIHHLALHRAGLVVRGAELPGDSRESFLHGVRTSPAESKPGDQYRYTNAGYGVMAAIIEIVSGTSYNDYVRHAILLPLGLREAYFRDETVPGLALGYQKPPDNPGACFERAARVGSRRRRPDDLGSRSAHGIQRPSLRQGAVPGEPGDHVPSLAGGGVRMACAQGRRGASADRKRRRTPVLCFSFAALPG